MFKNKYVFWSGIGVWLLVLAGGGLWFWQYNNKKQSLSFQPTASQSTASTTDQVADSQPTQSQTIIAPSTQASGATVIKGNTAPTTSTTTQTQQTPQIAGASTQQNDASKLLDPTTFSQYDKYKNDQSAYYIDLQTGSGNAVSSGKKVAVYYKGWLTNGKLFDQSRAGSNGQLQASTFTQGSHQVITGWEQALDGMKVGGVRLLIIPPTVGYGATAQNGIPANSVLVFQVQLAAVQ